MAETTDRTSSTEGSEDVSLPSSYPGSATASEPETYQPLSLLALVGCGISLLYAIIVAILALAGLLQQRHSLLPMWSILVPLLAIAICFVALLQIRQSEGALAGEKLAKYGMGICLFFGLTYWAYYAAVYFAIRQQADSQAEQWIRLIQEDKINQAYLRTMTPTARGGYDESQDEAALHKELLNRSQEQAGGAQGLLNQLSAFGSAEYVQLLREGGADANISFHSVQAFTRIGSGFEVTLRYHVETKLESFYVLITTQGVTAQGQESSARNWTIQLGQSGLDPALPREKTPLGKTLADHRNSAREFFSKTMILLMADGDLRRTYLNTLPPNKRAGIKAGLARRSLLGGLIGGGIVATENQLKTWKLDLATLMPDYDKFTPGSLYDASNVEAPGLDLKDKQTLIETLRQELDPKQRQNRVQGSQSEGMFPTWGFEEPKGILTFRFPTNVTISRTFNARTETVVKGRLDELKAGAKEPKWWIDRISIRDASQVPLQSPEQPPGVP